MAGVACVELTGRRTSLACLNSVFTDNAWIWLLIISPSTAKRVTVWMINGQPKNSPLNRFYYEWSKKPWRACILYIQMLTDFLWPVN